MDISTYLNNLALIIINYWFFFVGIDVFFFFFGLWNVHRCAMTNTDMDSVKAPICGNRNSIKLVIYNFGI